MMTPNLYIIAGCNGAGKTTASMTLLPEILDCHEFVNADNIAKGLSPFRPERVAFEAGRIMLHRIEELMSAKVDFAFETTLATKSYRGKVLKAQEMGYKVTLVFLWLPSPEMAIERVAKRVAEGGHDIPKDVIGRRYVRGITNLLDVYLDICDEVMVVDGRSSALDTIAEKSLNTALTVLDPTMWNNLKAYNDEQ
jgi:predicted ABC-type ATPase